MKETIKPSVHGSYQEKPWGSYEYDTPLFSEWTVYWEEPAGCGHKSCGIEGNNERFATWSDALRFASSVIKG